MNGTVRYLRRRLADVAKGMRLARTQVSREQGPRAQLASRRQRRLDLRRDRLLDWAGRLTGDRLYLDRYRVLLTSGSSGRQGLFVYDAAGGKLKLVIATPPPGRSR